MLIHFCPSLLKGQRLGFILFIFSSWPGTWHIMKLSSLSFCVGSLPLWVLRCYFASVLFWDPASSLPLHNTLCCMSVFSVYKKKIWSASAWQLEKQSCTGAKRFCSSDKQGGEPPASSGYVGRGLNHRVLRVPWKKRTQRNITQHGEMRRISRDMKITERLKNTVYKVKNSCERKKLWVSLPVPRRSVREQVSVWRMLNRCSQEERNAHDAHEIILAALWGSETEGRGQLF